jgi:hypothetical protein
MEQEPDDLRLVNLHKATNTIIDPIAQNHLGGVVRRLCNARDRGNLWTFLGLAHDQRPVAHKPSVMVLLDFFFGRKAQTERARPCNNAVRWLGLKGIPIRNGCPVSVVDARPSFTFVKELLLTHSH